MCCHSAESKGGRKKEWVAPTFSSSKRATDSCMHGATNSAVVLVLVISCVYFLVARNNDDEKSSLLLLLFPVAMLRWWWLNGWMDASTAAERGSNTTSLLWFSIPYPNQTQRQPSQPSQLIAWTWLRFGFVFMFLFWFLPLISIVIIIIWSGIIWSGKKYHRICKIQALESQESKQTVLVESFTSLFPVSIRWTHSSLEQKCKQNHRLFSFVRCSLTRFACAWGKTHNIPPFQNNVAFWSNRGKNLKQQPWTWCFNNHRPVIHA